MNNVFFLLAISLLLAACNVADGEPGDAAGANPNDWLLNAESDPERFRLLQKYLRGFDQPMWEVGERYAAVFDAVERGNLELAGYHWDKIRTTIENGYLKRPGRRANAEKLFLDGVWSEVRDAFASGDEAIARTGFEKGREACMQCHVAESVSFMNDQPVFELRVDVPPR